MKRVSSSAAPPAASASATLNPHSHTTRRSTLDAARGTRSAASAGPSDGATGSPSVVELRLASCSGTAGPAAGLVSAWLLEEQRRRPRARLSHGLDERAE